ncbi:MAG: GntR family transcriptional regulator [Kiritimatiellia bacterium]|nr:GntR family transcriptional regulator [Lentisphaerota bacterium]
MNLSPRQQRFEQVKEGLTSAICDGSIRPGERLPSLRELCLRFNVSLATVQRAVRELKEEDWLVTLPCKGVLVADPLPPVAHLLRLRLKQHAPDVKHHPDVVMLGHDQPPITCLIHDEALVPLFEWAAREYAGVYAPCSLRFEVRSLRGRDDMESVRDLDADLVLLPAYAVGRAARMGSITAAEEVLEGSIGRLQDIPPGILNMSASAGVLWGVPIMIGGMLLAADHELCREFGLDPETWRGLEGLLRDLAAVPAVPPKNGDPLLFNLAFPMTLLIAAGCPWPGIANVPAWLGKATVRGLLEQMRGVARHPAVSLKRFDQWDQVDFTRVAVRHVPSVVYCHDQRCRARVLPIPASGALLTSYCMCVSARSVHPFEAWEWALHLAEAPMQERLAGLGYDLPVNEHPDVLSALARDMGATDASRLQALVRAPAAMYGMGPEDIQLYVWEVLGNELYRFVVGENDYARMLKRTRMKTERFLRRHAELFAGKSLDVEN